MRRRISLYIDNQLVDLDDESFLLFNYTFEDMTDPAIVKNSFSQQITIKGTPANDRIFGHFHRFDTYYDHGTHSPVRALPFVIYNDMSEVLESGYVKLDKVTRKRPMNEYTITLYGGLGDFFFNLSQKASGKMTLADLDFWGTASPDTEFNFVIDKYAVLGAWNKLAGRSTPLRRGMVYGGKILSPNGTMSAGTAAGAEVVDFDVEHFEKVYINGVRPSGTNRCMAVALNASGTALEHWEVGRGSGTQAPVIGLIATMPANAVTLRVYGNDTQIVSVNMISPELWDVLNFAPCYNGYPSGTFDADKAIVYADNAGLLSSDGQYSAKDGFVLVSFPQSHTEWEVKDIRSYLQKPVIKWSAIMEAICDPRNNGGYEVELDEDFFNEDNPYYEDAWMTLPVINTLDVEVTDESGSIQSALALNTPIVIPHGGNLSAEYEIIIGIQPLILSAPEGEKFMHTMDEYTEGDQYRQEYYCNWFEFKVIAYDSEDNVVTTTIHRVSTRQTEDAGHIPYIDSVGKFSPSGWFDRTIYLNVTGIGIKYIVISYQVKGVAFGIPQHDVDTTLAWGSQDSYTPNYNVTYGISFGRGDTHSRTANAVRTGATITKKMLLSSDKTPADYLLSYCKMFGLQFLRDKAEKKVSILTRGNFFNGTTIDLTNRVDIGMEVEKDPFAFESRWYKFGFTYENGEFAKYYNNVYPSSFGSVKHDTGYEFNADEVDVMESVIFSTAIEALESGKYYIDIVRNDDYIPAVFVDTGAKYSLYKANGEAKEYDVPVPDATATRTYLNSSLPSFDIFSKLQLHNEDNASFEERDTLVFFKGNHALTSERYAVTDDTTAMMLMNENTPCWWLDYQLVDESSKVSVMPMFTRYLWSGDHSISRSWDYGIPSEIPIPNVLSMNSGIMDYWSDYIDDRYDDDTAVMRCNVDLSGLQVNESLFRNFYYYEGSLWALNRIVNHSMTTYGPTECEFIRVLFKEDYE